MNLFSVNVQTTAEPRFRAMRKTNPNFNMGGGCCNKNRNPLKGWRKEVYCCRKIQNSRPNSSKNVIGWQSIIKNVDNCCRSHKKMIQNRAASSPAQTAANGGVAYRVSGKIDKKYNHNYRQYLKKRCMLPDSDTRTSSHYTFNTQFGSLKVGEKPCCTTECSGASLTTVSTYKRSNWGFSKQGAVDNDIYISKKSLEALNSNALFGNAPCPCCVCEQLIRGDYGGTPQPASVGATATGSVSGATGSVISAGLVPNYAVIALDDCNTPFVDGERVSFSGGTILTVDSSGAGPVTGPLDCPPPVPVRRPPQFPEDNPKNFNHNKNNLSNNF